VTPRAGSLRVDVALTPAQLPGLRSRDDLARTDVVVIDVLRATSTVVAALQSGCDGVRPVAGLEDAAAIARGAHAGTHAGTHADPGMRPDAGGVRAAVLGGEREGVAPPGFDLGNSPDEYTAAACGGRPVVLCTTNGTQAVAAVAVAGGARGVWAAGFLNAGATCRALLAGGARDVLLLCAGTRGRVAADDVAVAGCLAGSLLSMTEAAEPGDGARVAVALFEAWRADLPGLLRRSESGRRLLRIGLQRDIETCARLDRDDVAVRLDAAGVFRAWRPDGGGAKGEGARGGGTDVGGPDGEVRRGDG
jgi:2-phosphosulfolactate phosphatase